jgi:hypothetical protein
LTVEQLLKLDVVKPSEICRLGGKVTIFTSEKADDEYHWGRYHGKAEIVSLPAIDGENWKDTKWRIITAALAVLNANPEKNILYTGIHKENDQSRTYYWCKGWHIVNTTADFAVVRFPVIISAPQCGVDCHC